MDTERRLSLSLRALARAATTEFAVTAIVERLLASVVELVPATAAGVTLLCPGDRPRHVAGSDPTALSYEHLQADLDEGPSRDASRTGRPVSLVEVRHDGRYPAFASATAVHGLAATFAFPLFDGDTPIGVLDLYRSAPGPLDPDAVDTARTLADVVASYLVTAWNCEDLQRAADRSRRLSRLDDLTGLPNRSVLTARLEHAVVRHTRTDKLVAILFADLDRFKGVNDTFGHLVGDELLVAVARRLAAVIRPGDTLARFGGDEFVLLCEELSDPSEVGPLAARIHAAVAKPFALSAGAVHLTTSIGIAFVGPGDGPGQSHRVIHEADTAMYVAKRAGGGRACIAAPASTPPIPARVTPTRETAEMAFGQPSGPPATAKQVQELLGLVHDAGHVDFRDARGPLGLTQRQAAGRFTRDEASAFIDRLQEEGLTGSERETAPTDARTERVDRVDRTLAGVHDERLAAELQRRGWMVIEPLGDA